MLANNTLPQFLYIYVPNMHTGTVRGTIASADRPAAGSGRRCGAWHDRAAHHEQLGLLQIQRATARAARIFFTVDDAQSTLDHIHEHRTPLVVISPYAKVTRTAP